jgi:hypothetical protein
MTLQGMGLDIINSLRRPFQSAGKAIPPPLLDSPEALESSTAPLMPMHVTRILGKLCFSCHTLNACDDKFCVECGSPLFRPTPPPRPAFPAKIRPS